MREVLIDNRPVDVNDSDVAGYIFTSPIFRDISKILSNRTTTYKIPKTQHNLSLIGLMDNPDIEGDFPYREHTFEEIRDGLPFIKGVCTLLQISDNDIELSVVWGNTINILKLKDLKLRDFTSQDYLLWNNDTGFMSTSNTNTKGFLPVDFGRGINLEYTHPSVSMQYILDLIYQETGVLFTYPSEFEDSIKKTWIPLIDKEANYLVWDDPKYWVKTTFKGISSSSDFYAPSRLKFDMPSEGNSDLIQNYSGGAFTLIKAKKDSVVTINGYQAFEIGITDATQYKLKIYAWGDGVAYQEQIFSIYRDDANNRYLSEANLSMSFSVDKDMDIEIRAVITLNGVRKYNLLTSSLVNVGLVPNLTIYVKYEEIRFGDKYPIVANLPDISVVDFIKTIMNMFGLFTYYDFNNENTISFISMDNVYGYKPKSIDCTDKIVTVNDSKMQLSFTYGEYARRNNFYYKEDDTVTALTSGYITIDNQALPDKKDLVTLLFAASDNVTDENANTYARIKLYEDDGSTNKVEYRLLVEGVYDTNNTDNNTYKTAYFPEEYSFAGNNGLLSKYYSAFQYMLRRPVVVDCYLYFQDFELTQFREVYPIYIDGVYYMPIEVTAMNDGYARAKLIKMPNGWTSPR